MKKIRARKGFADHLFIEVRELTQLENSEGSLKVTQLVRERIGLEPMASDFSPQIRALSAGVLKQPQKIYSGHQQFHPFFSKRTYYIWKLRKTLDRVVL